MSGALSARWAWPAAALAIVLTGACQGGTAMDIDASATAAARVAELRARFVSKATGTAVIGGTCPTGASAQATSPAAVELPLRAPGFVRLEDPRSHLGIGFALRGASDVPVALTDGYAIYRGALGGADVVHRVDDQGTEDYVVFERRPARPELTYEIDVSHVEGLRLVSNTLEFLDAGGTPRLRVAPPFVVDEHGTIHEAKLAVRGCAFDAAPSAPWGRPTVAPGANGCILHVTWPHDVGYPLIVDPTWTNTGSMALARSRHTTTILATGKLLVAGGSYGPDLNSAELFDPATKTFAATGTMAAARYFFTASLLGSGKVLVAGGFAGVTGTIAGAELYDPATGIFSVTGALTTPRSGHTANVLASGKVLMAAGAGILAAELYDPAAGTFSPTGAMAVTRSSHTSSMLPSGKVLIAAGYVAAVPSTTAEIYDPVTGTFSATGSLVMARSWHSATDALPSGKVLVTGGSRNDADLASAELYDPATGTFVETGPLGLARSFHTSTTLASGKALVVGGFSGAALTSAELFDPATGLFTATKPMNVAREYFTATTLASGKVLVVGGQFVGGFEKSAELLDLVPTGSNGCTTGDDCVTGFCQDGVCCAGACSGACKTCSLGTGACVAVTNADDPDSCTGATTCDAVGSCRSKKGEPCPGGDAVCASGFCADGYCCNAACSGGCDVCNAPGKLGTCSPLPLGDPGANPTCGAGLVCDGVNATCATTCTTDGGCSPSFYCAANGTCQAQKKQGTKCDAATDCKGAGCRVCTTGSCSDGVCCDSACTGTCEACTAALKQSGADGACGPAKDGSQSPHGSCTTDPVTTCGHDGKCNGAGGCRLYYPGGTPCGPAASCTKGLSTSATACNGNGACVSGTLVNCGAYSCGATACNTTCASDIDCATGSTCDAATHKCIGGATCDGDHTTTGANGAQQDCLPYKCSSTGACKLACETVDDCVAPTQCDPTGRCVTPTDDEGSTGCSVTRPRPTSSSLLAALALAVAICLRLRRVRDRRPRRST